jgi:ATP-dependent DNA helicase RecQ
MQLEQLAELPESTLEQIPSDRRRHLVEYLLRWGEPQAALRALDYWLQSPQHSSLLPETRVRVLQTLQQYTEALDSLDAINARHGMSESRRSLRIRLLAALGRIDDAEALLNERSDDLNNLRLRAEVQMQLGDYEAAELLYTQADQLSPKNQAVIRDQIKLALARGNAKQAQHLVMAQREQPDTPFSTTDLLLFRQAIQQQGFVNTLESIDAQLTHRRTKERTNLCVTLGLNPNTFEPELRPEPSENPRPSLLTSSSNPTLPVIGTAPEVELPPEAYQALREHFGFQNFRPGQSNVLSRVLQGQSTLAILPTGAGKSLTYQLPAMLLDGATLVISPLIALMKDQIDNLPPSLAERAATIHSGLTGPEVVARLRGVAQGKYKLIYVAPERLRQQGFLHRLARVGVGRVIIDEAHCVSLWGMSFRPDYLFIRRAIEALDSPPVLALTATATPETEREIKTYLGDMQTLRNSVFRPNLRFEVHQANNRDQKIAEIISLCKKIEGAIVIYARSRESCEEIAYQLRSQGVAAEHYHAQIPDRHRVQDEFMSGAIRVLVATVAFGMGVDKPDVRAIIHYNLPQSIEAYYQEAGRAGRDGMPARCILLYSPYDKGQLTAWLREDSLDKQYLRDIYRVVRSHLYGNWGVVSFDTLRADLREEDETRLRVGLGMLERVGVLVRHFDLPYRATISLRNTSNIDSHFARWVDTISLQRNENLQADMIDLAMACGYTPNELERQLLRWQDNGWLRYEPSQRDALFELRPSVSQLPERIDQLIATYARSQDLRIEAISDYARSHSCRHRTLAAHFGETIPRCGNACDICQPKYNASEAYQSATDRLRALLRIG